MSDTTELIQADYTIDDACVSGNVFAKQAVEGIIADVLCQVKMSVDVALGLHGDAHKLSQVDNIKATFGIARAEVGGCLDMLKHYSNAALTPKHRYARACMFHFASVLDDSAEDVSKVKGATSKHLAQFGRNLVEFMTNLHMIMADSTSDKKRVALVSSYTGKVPGANGEILH
jgi:hypothetical protein